MATKRSSKGKSAGGRKKNDDGQRARLSGAAAGQEDGAQTHRRSGRVTLSAADWVEAATDVLVNKSVDAVRVETVAKDLGVTKGSFYWHFADRPSLLDAIIDTWKRRATAGIIYRTRGSEAKPQEKLRVLMGLPRSSDRAIRAASIELAIRAWARRDQKVRATVDAVDRERLEFTADIYREFGLSPSDAANRAYLAYSLVLAQSLIQTEPSPAAAKRRRRFIEAVVTGEMDLTILPKPPK